MTKTFYSLLAIIIAIGIFGWYLFTKNVGVINVPKEAETDIKISGEAVQGITVPAGFKLSTFSTGITGARVMEMDPKGRILVSQTSEGKIIALGNYNDDNFSDESEKKVLIEGLKKPHGMAFYCNPVANPPDCDLYVAEADALSKYKYNAEEPSLGVREKLLDIDYGITDRHFTRSLVFLPYPNGNILLVSVGSSCDVCSEGEKDNGKILSYNIDTKKTEVYATGLRNATFMTLDPIYGKVFATEMGRDGLGDDIPPDEINIIEKTKDGKIKNYGWPICYGKNIHDNVFDPEGKNTCSSYEPSFVDLQAHSAPLGLSFIPEEGWPEEYWYNLLVAYHGSWNRTEPTGYKIVRLKMNAKGEYLGTEDFITGWLVQGETDKEKLGRPADIKVFSGGVAYISDDSQGVIYRLARE